MTRIIVNMAIELENKVNETIPGITMKNISNINFDLKGEMYCDCKILTRTFLSFFETALLKKSMARLYSSQVR